MVSMGREGDGKMGRWGDGEMGREGENLTAFGLLLSTFCLLSSELLNF
jgi:hypothetical protein